jgi:hypothetical protein
MPEEQRNPRSNGGEALAWADTYAEVNDFRFALRWLELAERLMGGALPAPYMAKRAIWTLATRDGDATARAASR